MASETTATKTSAPKKSTVKKVAAEPQQPATEQKPIIPREIDSEQYVSVRNGFRGRLIYKSKRTGETYIWDGFGDEQEMTLRELKNAKSAGKKFFMNNWFMFDDDWVVDYLGVRPYYKKAIPIDKFDDIFTKSASEVKKTLEGVSDGQKRSIAYRAHELIAQNKIDSRSVIAALEESLGIELIEK